MPAEAVDENGEPLLQKCRSLERAVSKLRGRDPAELGAAEARALMRRFRRLRRAVEQDARGEHNELPPETRKRALEVLERIRAACREASRSVDAALAEMRSGLCRLSEELERLRSYRRGAASRRTEGR